MYLKDFNNLWGIPLSDLKHQGKKYKIYSMLIYTINIIIMVFCGIYMYNSGSDFVTCIFATVAITLLSVLILSVVINPEKWRAYLFYKKYKKLKVKELKLYVKEDNMKSILYCTNYKSKKVGADLDDYKDLMLSACREDSIFSKRIGTLLSKFTINEEGMTEITVYMMSKGSKSFLVDFKNEEVSEN